MSIICTRCGGTQVVCEATVNPNTKVITEISDDSLQFGRCETCKARSVLTDVEKTKAAIKSGFAGFVEANGRKPHYASCRIVWKYTNDSEDVKIRLLESGESIGNDMFFSCNSLHALESLAEFGKEPFIVTECYGFKTLTEEEISDEKAYEYEFGDEKIVVTGNGCGGCGNGCGNDSCLWIILLLCCCGGWGNNGCGCGGNGCGCGGC